METVDNNDILEYMKLYTEIQEAKQHIKELNVRLQMIHDRCVEKYPVDRQWDTGTYTFRIKHDTTKIPPNTQEKLSNASNLFSNLLEKDIVRSNESPDALADLFLKEIATGVRRHDDIIIQVTKNKKSGAE